MPNNQEEPIRAYGHWEIMPDCTLRNRIRRVEIYADRLQEPDLFLALHSSRKVADDDWNNFIPAFFFACRMAGILTISHFQVDYE